MSRTLRRGAFAAVALALSSLAAPLAGQSLLASRGLGYPIDPIDARARGLGGLTTGLAEPGLSMVNPASAVGIAAPGLVVAFQPDRYDATAGDQATSGTTSRFPLLMAAFPAGRFVAQVGYGAFLDQHWQVSQEDSIDLPSGRVAVRDRFASGGGVARFRGGVGYRAGERLALGAALDVFTGAAHDSASRELEGLSPALSAVTFTYRGVGVAGGARWNASEALSVSAAVRGGGTIRAESDDSVVSDLRKEYTNPVTVDAGASANLGTAATLAVSGRWAQFSALDDELGAESGGARDLVSGTAGVEFLGFQPFGRVVPLRLGGRYTQLPFRWGSAGDGNAFPNERAVTAGAGLRIGARAAQIDAAAERGWRGGGDAVIDEPYWRFSFSLSVLGR